jgi:tRNA 2-(methylsulfanyl)-N6-isopentenyladenosine37 hydroxylase
VSEAALRVARTAPPATLLVATPPEWFERAQTDWRTLLVDHANCEKKAASTALSLIFSYAEDSILADRMSRLAREELRHFEQVQGLMRELSVPFARLPPSRYAQGLRRAVRTHEPGRLLDLLICGAFVEARSFERFAGLSSRLTPPMGPFYGRLQESEARHHLLYLRLATQRAPGGDEEVAGMLKRFGEIEAELVSAPDPQFRFHSGRPA